MKFTDLKFVPQDVGTGKRATHFFPNGYGVCVVQFITPSDQEEDLYEVMIVKGNKENYDLYDNAPISGNEVRFLNPEQVELIISQVENLQ